MWERLYDLMFYLNKKIELHPWERHFTIEIDVDLYEFCNKIGFIPDNGIFMYNDRTFTLG